MPFILISVNIMTRNCYIETGKYLTQRVETQCQSLCERDDITAFWRQNSDSA
jgi:hypothetical protein